MEVELFLWSLSGGPRALYSWGASGGLATMRLRVVPGQKLSLSLLAEVDLNWFLAWLALRPFWMVTLILVITMHGEEMVHTSHLQCPEEFQRSSLNCGLIAPWTPIGFVWREQVSGLWRSTWRAPFGFRTWSHPSCYMENPLVIVRCPFFIVKTRMNTGNWLWSGVRWVFFDFMRNPMSLAPTSGSSTLSSRRRPTGWSETEE